jgi:hypothetical protein
MDRMGWDGMHWDAMGSDGMDRYIDRKIRWIDIFLWPHFAMVKLHEMNVINGGA